MSENQIAFNLEIWTFAEYFAFSRAMMAGQLEIAYELLRKVVGEAEFASLNAETGAALLNRVFVRLGKDAEFVKTPDPETQKAPYEAVSVNLSKWSIPQIYEFERVNRMGNIPELQKMMKMVAQLDGVNWDEPLEYMHGLLIKTAIMTKHSKVLSGKN